MFLRLLITCLLTGSALAGNIFDSWKAGDAEKLYYDLNTLKPSKTTNTLEIEFARAKEKDSGFIVSQILKIPAQTITITSTEKYTDNDLNLISSENLIRLPAAAKDRFGTDSLVIKAVREKDSVAVTSNSATLVPPCKLPLNGGLITSTGSLLATRLIDFKPGATRTYRYVNLLILTGQIYSAIEITDSVMGEVEITVPAGTFDCYKVKNTSERGTGFSYYDKGGNHIPVRTELIDQMSGEPVMEVILKKIER
ncbi:MAG: hypothetical protein JSV44_03325 [Candidatus Zixiibacteriota bacterium]|nr:MAG: hypothetical protein JSV44_03325 [candidate division Zixibacteria bacterium]